MAATVYDPVRLSAHDIDALIGEDLPTGDLTTQALGLGDQPGRMTFHARTPLVTCGDAEAVRLLRRLGADVTHACGTGTFAVPDTLLLEAQGGADALLAGWKLAQTVMEWASGIATAAHGIVTAARAVSPTIAVTCTRKSVPFTRRLSLKAVMAGGAGVHRLGLSDSIMLFPEHRVFLGADGLAPAVARLKAAVPERAVMVEVTSERDAFAAVDAMADVIQFEKFEPVALEGIVKAIEKRPDGRPILAAAGGITQQNAARFAGTGVDTLVTSAPFYARPAEIRVRIETA